MSGSRSTAFAVLLVLVLVGLSNVPITAQVGPEPAPTEEPSANGSVPDSSKSFDQAAVAVRVQLETSLAELGHLYDRIAAEKLPLSRDLGERESALMQLRLDYQARQAVLDGRSLDLNNLRTDIKARQDEVNYLANLLGEYVRNYESRLHIAELQRYESALENAKLAADAADASDTSVFEAQAAILDQSLGRLEEALDGVAFRGTAVDPDRLVRDGTFAMIGPVVLFRSDDAAVLGTAEQRLGSLEPAVIAFEQAETARVAAEFFDGGSAVPLDPTLGDAHKIEATKETVFDEIKKGGTVMWPIFAMAALAFLVGVYKWLTLAFIRRPSRKQISQLLTAVGDSNHDAVVASAARMPGPMGRMFQQAAAHFRAPRDLIEEVMYETVLTTKLRVNGLLPFIAICAAAAPLLGLLGTVTGIIFTFKQITVFGSGDVKMLSGGISEALITTKYGLIVAIPSLLLHAYLARKARGVIGDLETGAVSFINRLESVAMRGGSNHTATPAATLVPAGPGRAPDPELVRAQVSEILADMLGDVATVAPRGSGRTPRSS